MVKEKFPSTQAIRTLKENGVSFSLCSYKYEEKGGTQRASEELGVDEHRVIKTLVMEDEQGEPFLVLMHGDMQVSTKALARILNVKTIRPCDPDVAHRHTGYVVGGTSPFGTKRLLRTYVEAGIMDLPEIYINAGKRGLLAKITPKDLARVLDPHPVQVAL